MSVRHRHEWIELGGQRFGLQRWAWRQTAGDGKTIGGAGTDPDQSLASQPGAAATLNANTVTGATQDQSLASQPGAAPTLHASTVTGAPPDQSHNSRRVASAPRVLLHLAHANGFCAGVYGPLAQELVRRSAGAVEVLALDQRGHGTSSAPADPRALRDWGVFGRDLAALFAHLTRPPGQRLIAVGHSLGGVASILAAAEHGLDGLLLLDPTIFPAAWRLPLRLAKALGLGPRFPIASRAARRRRRWPSRAAVRQAYQGKPIFAGWQPAFVDAYLHCALRPASDPCCAPPPGASASPDGPVELACDPAWEAAVFASVPHDVWSVLARLPATLPLAVLYGGRSDTFRPAAAARLARLRPRAVLRAWPDCGHFLPMERPGEVAAAILDLLDSWHGGPGTVTPLV